MAALVRENGTVAERYAYDPWGRRRDPANWKAFDTRRTAYKLSRGYTGHEHLDKFNVINMNGRVYDPLTAQFFSPDPYIQAPDNWLNYNRYSYCLNNPFKYTDPDGEWIWIVVGAVVGGVINVATHWEQIDGDWGKSFAAFGIGAAGGALAVATGGAALGAFGTVAGAGGLVGGAVAGGVGYSFGTIATGIANNVCFGDQMPTPQQFATGLAISMATAGLLNGLTAYSQGNNFWNGNPTNYGMSYPSPLNTATARAETQKLVKQPESPTDVVKKTMSNGLSESTPTQVSDNIYKSVHSRITFEGKQITLFETSGTTQFPTSTMNKAINTVMNDNNKLIHLFPSKHNLGSLVNQLGGQENTILTVLYYNR
ncbi:hypothetical protein FACS189429_5260 [Bacteroidia bacterium]|nr:hypothetical protein FACS189429_5260 [Bacteroidia bacterium]